ncbi:hypothetical protein DSO57_1025949 [Entomophthora muscae]|uniref:Uncharacterized protein n=1 Tax=Entomophthora muscae TaxID=34485 RepID=A0ACC2T2F8_9FUNG|nr:hypothetical protein DSO57_1025949 [Entomophthora muscae]
MSGLPVDWTPYAPGAEIPDGFVLYQNMVISLPEFNALSAQGFFQAPFSTPQENKKHHAFKLAQKLCSAILELFSRANNNNPTACIWSTQNNLTQILRELTQSCQLASV